MKTLETKSAEEVRKERAIAQAAEYEIRFLSGSQVEALVARNGAAYRVTPTSCTCPDHLKREVTCKHIFLLLNALAAFSEGAE